MIYLLSFLILQIFACYPAWAHEGTTGEHLILGLDTGIVFGLMAGFVAGSICTTVWLKRSR